MLFEDRNLAPYQGDEPYIFLSYSHKDSQPAADVIRNMNQRGFRIWYDEGLVPGKEWDENIARAIMGCSYFMALISRNYLDSANCRDELNYAREKKLPLLLIYLEDVELPAGMEMRLGRMLAIHRHKYLRQEVFFSKVCSAEGISACRNFDGQPPEEELAETPLSETVSDGAAKKPMSPLIKIGVPVLVAVLAALLLILKPGAKTPAPAVIETEAPAQTEEPAATAEAQPPADTEAPAAPATPAPTEAPAETTDPAQTADLSPEEIAYWEAEALRDQGKTACAALAFTKLGDYRDAQTVGRELWRQAAVRNTVSISTEHAIGLKEDGTVYVAGGKLKEKAELSGWGDLVAVAAGYEHSVGLKADGTLVSRGVNVRGERSLSNWRDVISIAAGDRITVGLKADGTVLARGVSETGQCDVDGWTDIVAIAVGSQHTVGLKADGTVVAVGYNSSGQCNVSEWTDIVAIAAGGYHTLGVKADGTVVAAGYNAYKQCNVSDWTDIVAVAAGKRHSVGLKADGTVVAVGYNGDHPCDVGDWQNVIEIACGESATIALCADGTALATGSNSDGQCSVKGWEYLRLPSVPIG